MNNTVLITEKSGQQFKTEMTDTQLRDLHKLFEVRSTDLLMLNDGHGGSYAVHVDSISSITAVKA